MKHGYTKKKHIKRTAAGILSAILAAGCLTPQKEESVPREPADYTTAKVSYLGPEGTYTQEACSVFFEKQGTYLPYTTVQEAVEALTAGETDYAVIPQENTIGGPVIDYVDLLLAEDDVFVTGEVELPIRQNLLVLPGTALEDVRTVYSHKQGLVQGKEWLEKNLPEAEIIEVSSTAEGARMVAERKDSSCAAIAAAACADVYGLEILAESIQNNDSNKTRFYVLCLKEPEKDAGDRLAFVASGPADGLPELMENLNKQGLTLVTIHARPLKTELGQYNYLIECSGGSYKKYRKLTDTGSFTFRRLGSFDTKQP